MPNDLDTTGYNEEELDILFEMDFEWRLTLAHFILKNCECKTYFLNRRNALFPVLITKAISENRSGDDVFAEYARKIHERHESGEKL